MAKSLVVWSLINRETGEFHFTRQRPGGGGFTKPTPSIYPTERGAITAQGHFAKRGLSLQRVRAKLETIE